MSMTILKNHHTFDVFWIKRRAVKGVNYTKIVCLRLIILYLAIWQPKA